MKKQFLIILVILGFINFANSQYYTTAQLETIHNTKSAFEGDMYLDTINKKYYIGLTHGRLGYLTNKLDSSSLKNDSLFLFWNFKETDTLDFSAMHDSSEWKFDGNKGIYLRRAKMADLINDDSVSFTTQGRLIISDSITETKPYYNASSSTQIFLANTNPTRNVARQISIANANTTGNSAYSLLTTATDNSRLYVGSHGSSRTLKRLGQFVAGNNEVVAIEGNLHIGTKENKNIIFGTHDTTRVIITEVGNMGINNQSPEEKLDVIGSMIEGRDKSDFGTLPTYGSCRVSHGIATFLQLVIIQQIIFI